MSTETWVVAGAEEVRLEEASREIAARDERIRQLEGEVAELRAQAESWRWDATTARRELSRLQGSRLWRLAHVYWGLRRRLGLLRELRPPRAMPAAVETGPDLPPGFPKVPAARYDVIVFSIIDWDFRFQRPQQLATQFGLHGHRVFYVSMGRLLPAEGPAWTASWKARNVVEIGLRSRRALSAYRGRLEEADLAVLAEACAELLETVALGDVVALVQVPAWGPLAERLRERFGWRIVYDCMDDWAEFPGFGPEATPLEAELVRAADLTVTSARRLSEKLGPQARRTALVPNGVDLEHYRRLCAANDLLGDVRHPVIGYFGALAPWVDLELIEAAARRFPQATFVLAGGAFDVDLSALERLPNVRLLGQRPYEEMPRLLWCFDVCLIPFRINGITEATNPVKLYEYLSAGKPVAASRLPELLPYEDLCELADGPGEFLAAIERALAEPEDDPRRDLRRWVAEESDWRERYRVFHEAAVETFPRVSVIVVTHGALPLTRRCLESLLREETWPRLEVLVVDNASPDDTPAWLRSLAAADPRVRVFLQERNLGFPAGNNLGLSEAQGEILLLLNSDTVVPPGMTGRLVRALQREPRLGLVCPTTNFCGNEALVAPGYEDLAGLPGFAAARARRHAGRLLDLPVAAMYCVALRREVWRAAGPLDEGFGIGMFEDDDYSLRVRQAGWRVACAEDAYVHHVGQGSFQSLSREEYEALWSRNLARYEAKWGHRWKPHQLRPGVAPVMSKAG